jgi:AcrR family transcriptional regulator
MTVMPLRGGPARQAELLGAVLEVLRDAGYHGLTVDAVAARAHASKQTIYRRWPSKADLVVAAFASAVARPPTPADAGSFRDDLVGVLESLVSELADLGDMIASLIGELRRNPELATAMRNGYLNGRSQAAVDVFVRARARGEIASDVDINLLWQVAPSMIFFRMLIAGEPVDREFTERLVDNVVVPLCRAGGTEEHSRSSVAIPP